MKSLFENRKTDFPLTIEGLSFSACFLDLRGVGNTPRQATGFFWRRMDRIYLITNWHNLSGKNIFNGKPMNNGWRPDLIKCEYSTSMNVTENNTRGQMNILNFDLEIDHVEPIWVQHQHAWSHNIDIVAIPIDHLLDKDATVTCMNDRTFANLLHPPGREVFLLGHPLPKKAAAYPVMFPIWKKGSIATELMLHWNMRPAFLIDCRTSPGMSGSPVFARDFGPTFYGPEPRLEMGNVVASQFMGIYSGRVRDDDDVASLGVVWHPTLIDELLQNPAPGSTFWKPSTLETFWDFMREHNQSTS